MNKPLSDYWSLLNDVEDWLEGGFRRTREVPDELRPPRPDISRPGTVAGAGRSARAAAQAATAAKSGSSPQVAEGRSSAVPGAVEDPKERARLLAQVASEINECTRCALCRGRSHAVPGEGSLDPLVMVVGEGPGADEDATGRPFVGKAGKYLDKWLAAIELSRESSAFIANIVKCRPPNNRDPLPEESATCRPFLDRQIELVRPRMILTVGRISSSLLSGVESGIGKLRGNLYRYKGIPLVPTYHPSGVLRNPEYRAPVWEDLRRLRKLLDESVS